jgi:3-oxoacyl-[acyl-carrier-protein] synthase III
MEPSWNELRKENSLDRWPNISQQGQTVFRWAVFSMSKAGLRAIEAAGITPADLAAFIPHQANVRIIESMAREIGIPDSVVIAHDIRTSGNTSAASVPLAMSALLKDRPDLHGGLALLIGYGAGLVYAGQVVELPPKPSSPDNT